MLTDKIFRRSSYESTWEYSETLSKKNSHNLKRVKKLCSELYTIMRHMANNFMYGFVVQDELDYLLFPHADHATLYIIDEVEMAPICRDRISRYIIHMRGAYIYIKREREGEGEGV